MNFACGSPCVGFARLTPNYVHTCTWEAICRGSVALDTVAHTSVSFIFSHLLTQLGELQFRLSSPLLSTAQTLFGKHLHHHHMRVWLHARWHDSLHIIVQGFMSHGNWQHLPSAGIGHTIRGDAIMSSGCSTTFHAVGWTSCLEEAVDARLATKTPTNCRRTPTKRFGRVVHRQDTACVSSRGRGMP